LFHTRRADLKTLVTAYKTLLGGVRVVALKAHAFAVDALFTTFGHHIGIRSSTTVTVHFTFGARQAGTIG